MGKTYRKSNNVDNLQLPTVRSLKTLRKRAGKARAIIQNTISPKSQFSPELFTQETVHKTHGKNEEINGFVLKLGDDCINDSEREPGLLPTQNGPTTQKLRRSLRLSQKSKNITPRATVSKYFTQETNFRACALNKKITDFDIDCEKVSRYFSQPQNCEINSLFKIKTAPTDKSTDAIFPQPNSHIKRNIDQTFKLKPLISSFLETSGNTNVDTNVNRNFENALSGQIKVYWTTDIRTQFARTITKGMDYINNKLSGFIMEDDKANQDYARQAQLLCQQDSNNQNDNGNIILDQKIYNHPNSIKNETNKARNKTNNNKSEGNRKPLKSIENMLNEGGLNNIPCSIETNTQDSDYRIPSSKWVLRTPEKKKSQPRLDNKTTMKYGLVRSSKAGKLSVYRVNKEYENNYFIGDDKNVPINNMFFGHIADFQQQSVVIPAVSYKSHDAVRYLQIKTSTAEEVYANENTLLHFPELDGSLNLSAIEPNMKNEYDPFLIGRPIKSKTTTFLKELKFQHDLNNIENDGREFHYFPRKTLFPTGTCLSDTDDDAIILN